MDTLAHLVMTWGIGTLFMTALVFGFFPTFVVNVLARIYPKGHPRRDELIAELRDVPRREQLIWVAEQFATLLFDGVPARVQNAVRKRRQARSGQRIESEDGEAGPGDGPKNPLTLGAKKFRNNEIHLPDLLENRAELVHMMSSGEDIPATLRASMLEARGRFAEIAEIHGNVHFHSPERGRDEGRES
ncbi:hypothetical protein [Amycolatopsis rubida]|uniref:Uncharacterized protein n=1 Tax=Amycolatopsis rubida TaxID=112413 RepID=A0A1I5KW27_9PSEU|nr:hypothetical protein [Amycolatopsis rubida]SFO88836.1 hypothetical protein SAMN05421854_103346 [Amycolatopsis rubida]